MRRSQLRSSVVAIGFLLGASGGALGQSHSEFRNVETLLLSTRPPADLLDRLELSGVLTEDYLKGLHYEPCRPGRPPWARSLSFQLPDTTQWAEFEVYAREDTPEPSPQLIKVVHGVVGKDRVQVQLLLNQVLAAAYFESSDRGAPANVIALPAASPVGDRLRDLAAIVMELDLDC